MSVLEKIQFAAAPKIGVADSAIIGAGATDCQNLAHALYARSLMPPCFIVAR
jgi:hypothetical protein